VKSRPTSKQDSKATAKTTKRPDPLDLARRLYSVTNSGKVEELEPLLAADVVDHGVGGPEDEDLRGSGAVREDVLAFREAFPDVEITLEDVFVSRAGDRVTARWRLSGTQQGAFQGIPASGRRISMRGIDVLRIEGGRIAERWGSADELGLLQQLVDRRQSDRRSTRDDALAAAERRRTGRRRSDQAASE
jgi:steroid delta-isomerase-like uncharacterized protein